MKCYDIWHMWCSRMQAFFEAEGGCQARSSIRFTVVLRLDISLRGQNARNQGFSLHSAYMAFYWTSMVFEMNFHSYIQIRDLTYVQKTCCQTLLETEIHKGSSVYFRLCGTIWIVSNLKSSLLTAASVKKKGREMAELGIAAKVRVDYICWSSSVLFSNSLVIFFSSSSSLFGTSSAWRAGFFIRFDVSPPASPLSRLYFLLPVPRNHLGTLG